MSGTQSGNTTSFQAVTQTLVLGHHVWTAPKLQKSFSRRCLVTQDLLWWKWCYRKFLLRELQRPAVFIYFLNKNER